MYSDEIDVEIITKEIDDSLNFLNIDPNGKRKNLTNSRRGSLNNTLRKTKSQILRLTNEIDKISTSDNSHVYEDKINEQNEEILKLKKDVNNRENEILKLNNNIKNLSEKINTLEYDLKEKDMLKLENKEFKKICENISNLLKDKQYK